MKREDYHEAEAREFVWNHLWRADSHIFVNCPILDIVEVDSLGNVPKWLFTTRDGEIKSKSAKNRNLAAVEKGLRCHVDKCEHGFHGYFCSPTSQDWYSIQSYEHLQELLQKHSSDMAIVPHPHPDSANAKFLEIKLWREEKNAVLEPKIKCFWLSHASAAGKVKRKKRRNTDMNLPQERLICRNNALIDTAKSFAFSLLAQLENRSNIKVHQFDFIVHVAEILSSVTGPDSGEASKIFRVHFHHATHINFDNLGSISALQRRKSEQFSQSIGEFSTKLSSHGFLTRQASIMSSMASSTTYIKPWTYCSGVFCTYAAMAADGSGAAEPSMGLDFEEGDVLVESQRAIQRHRPGGGSFDASNGEGKSEGSPSRKGSRSSQRGGGTPTAATVDLGLNETADGVQNRKRGDDVTGNDARVGTLLPLKSNKILYKNLVLVRDEIRRLEEIDRQYIDEAHDTSEKLDSIYSMREAMKSIWPLPLIKWWFAHGQFYAATQSSKGGIGRLPPTVNPEAIVPPSILSKLEKDKLKRSGSSRHIINDAIAENDNDEQNPGKDGEESEEEDDANEEESMGPNGRKNGKLRPPKLPKEPPTAMSLSLPEAIANPLSTANPAIPFSNKTNTHLSDSNYPSRQSLLNNPEDTKWFSLHHQDVAVCDRCYLVYCRLESFRKGKFNKLREALKQEKREKLNPEEQRQRDREIERRIFAQKQSTYKLSQSKPRRNDQGEYEPTPSHRFFANRGGSVSSSNLSTTSSAATSGHAPKGALPPLPWRLNDDEERDRYLAPASHSVAEKLMRKQPLRSMSAEPGMLGLDGESMSTSGVNDVEAAWDAMMQTAQKRMNNVGKNLPPLPAGLGNASNGSMGSQSNGSLTSIAPLRRPTNLTAQQTSLKVAVDQYTAENLLHPWQRDLKKLKEALHDVSGLNPVNNKNLQGMAGLQNKMPLENISSKAKSAAATAENPSDSGSYKGPGTLAKAVSFRLNEIGSANLERLPTSPLKSASSNRPGTSAQGSSRGGGSQGVNGNLSSPFGSPMRGIRSIGIADSHDEDDDDDDDMDIAGGGLGWNPFVIQQAH